MFKIKVTCHNLVTDLGKFRMKMEDSIEYHGNHETIDDAINHLNERIKTNLEVLNANSCNDFKVSFNDENYLAVIQCWTGKEAKMTEEELEGDRDYYNVIEYDIVYSGDVLNIDIPDEWLLA